MALEPDGIVTGYMKQLTVIYIGEKFYFESGTMMGKLYLEDGTRYDWGKASLDLKAGKTLTIRPANELELAIAHRKLREIKEKLSS